MNKWRSIAKVLGGSLVFFFAALILVTFLWSVVFGSVPFVLTVIWITILETFWFIFMNYLVFLGIVGAVALIAGIAAHEGIVKGVRELLMSRKNTPSKEGQK